MAFEYDAREVQNWGSDAGGDRQFVWALLRTGLGRITEENIDEWCLRVSLLNIVDEDPIFYGHNHEKITISREDIVKRVGLRSNVRYEDFEHWFARQCKELVARAGVIATKM